MRQRSWRVVLLLALAGITCFTPAFAVEPQSTGHGDRPVNHHAHLIHWTAVSTTAMGITGDVEVGPHEIIIDEVHRYRVDKLRNLTPREVEAARKLGFSNAIDGWELYKINISAHAVLKNGNTMCGHLPTTKMIMAQGPGYEGTELALIFLSGSREPFFQGWEKTTDSGVCGGFGYGR